MTDAPAEGKDEFFIVFDPKNQPLRLVKWPANSPDPQLWVTHSQEWDTGYPSLIDDISPLEADPGSFEGGLTTEEVTQLKNMVPDITDDTLAAWKNAPTGPPDDYEDRGGEGSPADQSQDQTTGENTPADKTADPKKPAPPAPAAAAKVALSASVENLRGLFG